MNYLNIIKNTLLAIIFITLGTLVYNHYQDFTSMKKTIEDNKELIKGKNATIKNLKADIEANQKVQEKKEAIEAIKEESIASTNEEKKQSSEMFDKIIEKNKDEVNKVLASKESQYLKPKVAKVKPKANKSTKEVVEVEQPVTTAVKLSEVRIDTIYLAYCNSSSVNDSQNCPGKIIS